MPHFYAHGTYWANLWPEVPPFPLKKDVSFILERAESDSSTAFSCLLAVQGGTGKLRRPFAASGTIENAMLYLLYIQ